MTVVRPELQFGVAELDGDGRVARLPARSRAPSTGSTAASSASSRASLDYLGEDGVLEREPLERLAADGQLRAFRHEGFWDCMDTYKDAVLLNDLWAAGEAPWKVWAGGGARERRSSPAPTASRLVAGAGAAGARRRRSTVLDARDARRARGLVLLGIERPRSSWSRATCATPTRSARRSASTRSTPSSTSPPRRSSAPRQRSPLDLRDQRPRDLDAARGLPARTRCRRVVVASSDKAYGAHDELPYREDLRAAAGLPYDASKAATDLDRALLLAHLRAAGRRHALREHLRRRRPQPLAPGPRGGRRRARRPPRR